MCLLRQLQEYRKQYEIWLTLDDDIRGEETQRLKRMIRLMRRLLSVKSVETQAAEDGTLEEWLDVYYWAEVML